MFINIPDNYSSLWGELVYNFAISEPEDLLVEIVNADDDTVIAVKKFYSSSEIKFNIARIIRQNILPYPTKSSTGFALAKSGFIRVYVRIGDVESSTRSYILAHDTPAVFPATLTTMPECRVLNSGESDSIFVITRSGNLSVATVKVAARDPSDYNDISTTFFSSSRFEEFSILTINADDYNENYQSIDVTIDSSSAGGKHIYYTLTPPAYAQKGYRVAWLSSEGSIECYTFPLVSDVKRLSDGGLSRTLRSAYGTEEEIEALSEIIYSVKVWHILDDGSSEEIEVTTNEYPVVVEGTLSIANIEIKERDESFN